MAPVSKTTDRNGDSTSPTNNRPIQKNRRNSKSHYQESLDLQTAVGSPPSSKSFSSGGGGRTNDGSGGRRRRSSGGGRNRRRRRSSPTTKSSAIKETLSSFGDDVIKVKNYPKLYGYDNHGYFQPDIPFDTEHDVNQKKSKHDEGTAATETAAAAPYGDNELATIISSHHNHDPTFQTRHFEKIDPSEVGVRSSKWQKIFQTSSSSSKFQKFKRTSNRQRGRRANDDWSSDNQTYFETFYDSDGGIDVDPPFWGVSKRTRDKISMLGLSLILHELACFTSCVLLGSTIFQGLEAISWVHQKPFTENKIFFKWFSSFQTLLVVITCVGFLNRVDTTERRSLWILPLFLIPVLSLSVSDYCNKAWELQRLECIGYYRLDKLSQQKVHLSQDCSLIENAVKATAATEAVASSSLSSSASTTPRTTSAAAKGSQSQSIPIGNVPPGVIKTEKEIKNREIKMSARSSSSSLSSSSFPFPAMRSNKSMTELSTRSVAPLVMRIISAFSTLIISTYLFCSRKTYFLIDLFGPPDELIKGNMIFSNGYEKGFNPFPEFGGSGDYVKYDNEDGVEVLYHHRRGAGGGGVHP